MTCQLQLLGEGRELSGSRRTALWSTDSLSGIECTASLNLPALVADS